MIPKSRFGREKYNISPIIIAHDVKDILWNIDIIINKINYNDKVNDTINEIILLINNKNFIKNIYSVREKLYLLFITNIDFKNILYIFLFNLTKRINSNHIIYEISKLASETDLKLCLGKRVVIHFENFLFKIMDLLNNHNIIL